MNSYKAMHSTPDLIDLIEASFPVTSAPIDTLLPHMDEYSLKANDPLLWQIKCQLTIGVLGKVWTDCEFVSLSVGYFWLGPESKIYYLPALLQGFACKRPLADELCNYYLSSRKNWYTSPSGEDIHWFLSKMNAIQKHCAAVVLLSNNSDGAFDDWSQFIEELRS